MKAYYQKRAEEYELVYEKPERQEDLRQLEEYLKELFRGKRLLEIACGTGYWTRHIAQSASQVDAFDFNQSMIDLARTKSSSLQNIHYFLADIKEYQTVDKYDALFGGFIWSHVLKSDLLAFVDRCLQWINLNGELVFIDNKFVKGSSSPISRIDNQGNQYQLRKLNNGEQYEVLKNFPTEREVNQLLAVSGLGLEWIEWPYYWLLRVFKNRKLP